MLGTVCPLKSLNYILIMFLKVVYVELILINFYFKSLLNQTQR
jgi:hypothetical protein